MYRIWYWAMIDRESDGRFIASIPDLGDVAARGSTEKDAVAHLTNLAAERLRAAVEGGQQVPHQRHFSSDPRRSAAQSFRWKLNAGQLGLLRPSI